MEKVRKDREEKESEATKNSSLAIFPNGEKGKGLMEYLPKVLVREQVKALIITSTQSKQKLEIMTFVLNTQVVSAPVTVTDIPVIAVFQLQSVNQVILKK